MSPREASGWFGWCLCGDCGRCPGLIDPWDNQRLIVCGHDCHAGASKMAQGIPNPKNGGVL